MSKLDVPEGVSPDYYAFRVAQGELETETGDWPGVAYSADPKWQMEFWKDWFAVCRPLNPLAARICVREINKLRGR